MKGWLFVEQREKCVFRFTFKESSKGGCFEAEIKKSVEKEVGCMGREGSRILGVQTGQGWKGRGPRPVGLAPACRRGASASEAQGQGGGRSEGTGSQASCKGSLLERREALETLLRGSGWRLAGTQRSNSRWCGGARLKLKARSLWWVSPAPAVMFLGYRPASRERVWRRPMRLLK